MNCPKCNLPHFDCKCNEIDTNLSQMKGILEFSLPEFSEDFKLASQAQDLHSVIFEFHHNIRRNYLKYNDKLSGPQYKIAEKIFDDFYDLITDNNIII